MGDEEQIMNEMGDAYQKISDLEADLSAALARERGLRNALQEIDAKCEADKTSGGALARACVFSIQLTAKAALKTSKVKL